MIPQPRQEFITLSTQEGIEPRWSMSGAGTLSKATIRVWRNVPDEETVDHTFKGSTAEIIEQVLIFLLAGELPPAPPEPEQEEATQ